VPKRPDVRGGRPSSIFPNAIEDPSHAAQSGGRRSSEAFHLLFRSFQSQIARCHESLDVRTATRFDHSFHPIEFVGAVVRHGFDVDASAEMDAEVGEGSPAWDRRKDWKGLLAESRKW